MIPLIENLASEFSHALAPQRILLTLTSGEKFETLAKRYIHRGLKRNIPSLFSDLKPLYRDELKRQTIHKIVEDYRANLESSENAKSDGRFPISICPRANLEPRWQLSYYTRMDFVFPGTTSLGSWTVSGGRRNSKKGNRAYPNSSGTVHGSGQELEASWRLSRSSISDGLGTWAWRPRSFPQYQMCDVSFTSRRSRRSSEALRYVYQEGCSISGQGFGRHAKL